MATRPAPSRIPVRMVESTRSAFQRELQDLDREPARSWPKRWTSPGERCWNPNNTPASRSRWTRPSATGRQLAISSKTEGGGGRRRYGVLHFCCRIQPQSVLDTLSGRERRMVRLPSALPTTSRAPDEIESRVYGVTRNIKDRIQDYVSSHNRAARVCTAWTESPPGDQRRAPIG